MSATKVIKRATKSQLMLYVAAGVAALTEYFGDQSWVDRIDLNRFDFQNTDFCIAGQLFSGKCDGSKRNPWQKPEELMGLKESEWTDVCLKAAFELPKRFDRYSTYNWDLLGACWVDTITHLKAARVKVSTVVMTNVDIAVNATSTREAKFGG